MYLDQISGLVECGECLEFTSLREFYRRVDEVKNVKLSLYLMGPLNCKISVNYIERPSPYRAVNTLRLGYKNQPVNAV
jgi:hypothetical protein